MRHTYSISGLRGGTFNLAPIKSSLESWVDRQNPDEILEGIESLLLNPMTTTSEQFRGPDGKPLGVEVAVSFGFRMRCHPGSTTSLTTHDCILHS